MELIQSEGADLVIHQGDLGYSESDPDSVNRWETQLNDVLGPDFPYFVSPGNHDVANWPAYQQLLVDRLNRLVAAGEDVSCSGDYGVDSSCNFRGLTLNSMNKAPCNSSPVPGSKAPCWAA